MLMVRATGFPFAGAVALIGLHCLPARHGLRAYLCNYVRCIALSGASGTTAAFNGDSAYSNFSFAFVIDGSGGLSPALQGESNYVAVSYE